MTQSPRIVVLNLKRRPDRWAAWVQEAERMGIKNYTRWEAVDGDQVTVDEEIKKLFRDNDFKLNSGVMGCALSHMNIWLYVIENNLDALIVLEDDARFNEPVILPDLPKGWDLFYLGGAPLPGVYPPAAPVNDVISIPQLPQNLYFTTIGYMISASGAYKLLNRLNEIGFNKAVDWFMTDTFKQLNVFCFRKFIIYPDKSAGSDVKINP